MAIPHNWHASATSQQHLGNLSVVALRTSLDNLRANESPRFRDMKPPLRANYLITAALLLSCVSCSTTWRSPAHRQAARASLWLDALQGEPVGFQEMLEDLRHARVIYLGEIHSIRRHHELEKEILQGLTSQGANPVLAMEQFEFFSQPTLDQFNSGALDLNGLIRGTDLEKRWPGQAGYHALITAARSHGVPLLALNARAETIRSVGRHGLANLAPEQRRELPEQIVTADPVYERWLNKTLGVHLAFDPNRLQSVFQAQVARDETMAERLAQYLNSPAGQHRTAVVVCGQGHCEYGLGVPARVARRIPGIVQRIVLFSESGDLQLTEQERKEARTIEVTHEFLRELGLPPADYFHVIEPMIGGL